MDFELELQIGLWAGLDANGGDASGSALQRFMVPLGFRWPLMGQ